jgi:hypothetical protein
LAASGEEVTYESVTASTADNTLKVGKGVTIKKLNVKKGNILVKAGASIEAIERDASNTDAKTTVIYETGATVGNINSLDDSFEVKELVASNVRFYYSRILSNFYCDLYKTSTGEYTFKNFMKNEDLQFTLDANGYMTFTNLNVIEYGGVNYYLWGNDWSDSYKLYLTAEEGYYLDYCYFYGAAGYNKFYPDGDPNYSNQKWGMICFSYYKYQDGSDDSTPGYEYIYIDAD